jgi:rod shape-determining protein MreC
MRNSRRSRLVLTLLLLAAFSLITLDYRSNALSGVRTKAATVFGPIEDIVSDVVDPIGSWFSSIGHLGRYKSENSALQKQVAALQSQLHLTAAERIELAADQKLLHIASIAQFRIVAARVIAYGGGLNNDQTVTIDRGSANGITENETVINGDGLVGRTVVVGRTTSTVLLADDPTFSAGARTEARQLEIGSVTGGGPGKEMSLTLFNGSSPLTVGEQVVTAGDPDYHFKPFVPEVPIGHITQVTPPDNGLSETATVQPFVDYTALDIVAVVVHAPATIKHDSLLPNAPTPAPTVTVTVTANPGSTGSPPTGQSTSPNPNTSTSSSP